MSVYAWPAAAPPASAAGGQVLSVGRVVALDQPGVTLRTPADGRVAGYAFSGAVTGVAFTGHAGNGAQAVSPAAGATLVVLSAELDAADLDAPHKVPDVDGDAPVATLVSGSQQVGLPLDSNAAGWHGTWAVAVADGAPAVFSATEAGFTQGVDLRTGRRTSPSPAVLYRSSTPDVVTMPNSSVGLSATTSVSGTAETVPFMVGVTTATLSYFAPDTTTASLPPDQAFLVVDTSSPAPTDGSGDQIDVDATLPASAVALHVGGGAAIQPISGGGYTDSGTLFADTYTFVVPADLTTASLVVTPGSGVTGTASVASTSADVPVTFDFASSATLTLTFPPPTGTGRGTGGTIVGVGGGSGSSSSTGAEIGAGLGGAALVLLVALAIALARRRWLPARPVTRSQGALLAATAGELLAAGQTGWGAPAALPPAPAMLVPGPPPRPVPDPPPTATHGGAGPSSTGPALVIRVLGRLDVEGLVGTVRRRALIRLLVCLAVEDREVPVEELRDLVATDPDKPPSAATVHSLASKLRAHLPAGLLPPIGPGQLGYRLDPAGGLVEVDWQLFTSLTTRAQAVPDDGDRLELLGRALRLVGGPPLDHGAWEGTAPAVRAMETAIETTATDTARLALTLRDPRTAEWAVAQGLRALPGSVACWELRLIASAGGSGVGLERAWQACTAALHGDAEMLRPTYERLRSGSF